MKNEKNKLEKFEETSLKVPIQMSKKLIEQTYDSIRNWLLPLLRKDDKIIFPKEEFLERVKLFDEAEKLRTFNVIKLAVEHESYCVKFEEGKRIRGYEVMKAFGEMLGIDVEEEVEEEKKLTPQQLRKNIFLKGWKILNNNKRRLAVIMNRKFRGFYIIFFIIILLCSFFLYKDSKKKENDNKKFEELIEKANEHIEAEDYKNAEKITKESLKYSKVKGYYYLGALYANYFNDKEKAKEAYMVAYKKKNFEAASMIGFIEEEKGNFKEAEKWYKEGIKSNLEYSFYLIGNFYYNQNDMENAKKYLEKSAERKNGKAIYILAKIYYKEKNRERIKEYQKQLLERSQLYGVTKDMKKNIEYMLGNQNDNKYFDLVEKANEYIDKEEYKKAEEILLEASKLNKEGYYQIAEMHRYISIEEAIKKYEVAYEKGIAKAASNIGSYYFINKDMDTESNRWRRC